MEKKKLMYFMPDNPISGAAGNLKRTIQTLDYLTQLSYRYEIHYVSIKDWNGWTVDGQAKFEQKYPHVKLKLFYRKDRSNKLKYWIQYKIANLFSKLRKTTTIALTNSMLCRKVKQFVDKEEFDIAIISYASWANIIENINTKPYLILDTHDFMTGQMNSQKNIGKLMQEEMDVLSRFDHIWTYSVEEEYIFGQFTDKKITLMPISFPLNASRHTGDFKYDILYVASDNCHNIKSFNWFIQYVLPLLKDVKVHAIGKICDRITSHPDVVKYGVVDDIESFYLNAKIAICPMLSGTGIKIKVLEALSYGLPIVTNRRGVDGLMNKSNNGCLVSEIPEQFAQNIEQLLHDDVYYQYVRGEGIRFFEQNYTPAIEQKIMNDIFIAD